MERPPSATEFNRAIEYVRGHWERRFGLVQVG
jgi:hypothetical protein